MATHANAASPFAHTFSSYEDAPSPESPETPSPHHHLKAGHANPFARIRPAAEAVIAEHRMGQHQNPFAGLAGGTSEAPRNTESDTSGASNPFAGISGGGSPPIGDFCGGSVVPGVEQQGLQESSLGLAGGTSKVVTMASTTTGDNETANDAKAGQEANTDLNCITHTLTPTLTSTLTPTLTYTRKLKFHSGP